jgi:hypothetical protein
MAHRKQSSRNTRHASAARAVASCAARMRAARSRFACGRAGITSLIGFGLATQECPGTKRDLLAELLSDDWRCRIVLFIREHARNTCSRLLGLYRLTNSTPRAEPSRSERKEKETIVNINEFHESDCAPMP